MKGSASRLRRGSRKPLAPREPREPQPQSLTAWGGVMGTPSTCVRGFTAYLLSHAPFTQEKAASEVR